MRTDRAIMNQIARESSLLYELSSEEIRLIKSLLIEMYNDIADLCRKSGLAMMLIGGSALGAVRHKGFIPWDDDLDLCMPRTDYNKFVQLLELGRLGDKYSFTVPSKENDTRNLFLKVYRKGTVFSEVLDSVMPFPKGVFIDIFPIENAPKSRLRRRVKGFLSDVLSFISVSVLYYQYPSDEYRKFMSSNKEAHARYRLRRVLGFTFSFMPHQKWAYLYDRFVQQEREEGYCTIPTGTRHYWGETLPTEIFFPMSKGRFENVDVNLPNNADAYLRNMYGDYMKVPPIEKRERHFVYKFSIYQS